MNRFLYQFIFVAVVVSIGGLLVSGFFNQAPNYFNRIVNPEPRETIIERIIEKSVPYESPNSHEEAIIKAVDLTSPSVVSVIVTKDLPVIENCAYDPFGDLPPELKQFFGNRFEASRPCEKDTRRQEVGGGSGFIISEDGMIVTNRHVVEDEDADYTVLTNDGKKYNARVLARDPIQDLAIVDIEVTGFPALKLSNSDSIKLGQTVIAIGNALGEFRNTVSVGVVSGLARSITASTGLGDSETLEGLIQTDAAINPGNSGGPLLNLRGEVIGINTAIVSGAQSIGFAIPINKAKRDIESVRTTGKIVIPYMGVRYIEVTDYVKEKEQLSVNYGALLRGNKNGPAVVKDSPAEKVGLRAEDIVLEVNGMKINEAHQLSAFIQEYAVGDVLRLVVLRNGAESVFNVLLEERKF
ncbi:MAG: trypsin-like peptidase domain-containing protein [bacterium]|nr:trypsin-like peptidase domain-containing protein [bacterium]